MHAVLVPVYLLLVTPITGSWWAAGNLVVMDPFQICRKSRRLRGKLADICRNEGKLLEQIGNGVLLGQKECQHQFRFRRWNCTSSRRSMRKILLRDTRETGFVNAITAAGVTYAITRACTMGDLLECSCDKNSKHARKIKQAAEAAQKKHQKTSKHPKELLLAGATTPAADGDWEWGGCGDNINFGFRKSKDFMDSRYKRRSDMKTLVKLHNYAAGRLAIKNYMRTECKCHGLSGSCTLRTCWRKMPPFRDVANLLKERFDGAAKVIAGNDGHSFIPEGETIKPPGKLDLVYFEESPKFCTPNVTSGSLGTQGRACNATSLGEEGCDILCCGRGYSTKDVVEEKNCNCQFHWCCEVKCQTCKVKRVVNTCL